MDEPKAIGSITWMDLTVPDAEKNSLFYERVAGWKRVPLDMDGYNDFCMNTPGEDQTVAGICHARGENAGLPAQWLIYITVADLADSLEKCIAEGGKIVAPMRKMGGGRMAVIQDPAGAMAALYQLVAGAAACESV